MNDSDPLDPRKCGAHARHTGKPCQKWAINGAQRCKFHGGRTPKAKERHLEQQAERKLRKMHLAPVDDPLTAMAQVAAEVMAFKDVMGELQDRVMASGEFRYSTGAGEQLRAEIAVYERALDRCEKFFGTMARLNIDERLARVQEAQVDILSRALAAALADMGLGDRVEEARNAVAAQLRLVAS